MTMWSSPVPFAGETIFSFLARFFLRSAFRSGKTVARRLGIAQPHFLKSPLGGNFLGKMFEIFPELNGVITLKAAIERHTTVPLLLAFSEGANDYASRTKVIRAIGERGGWRGAPRSSKMLCPDGLRFCVECCAQDIREVGVPYWHREHQVKFVTRCWLHDTRLKEMRRAFGVAFKLDLPPIDLDEQDFAEVLIPDPANERLGVKVGLAAAEILNAAWWSEPQQIRQTFLDSAREHGLLYRGRPSRARIWNLMEDSYGRDFLTAMGLSTRYSGSVVQRYTAPFNQGKVRMDAAVVVWMAAALGIEPAMLTRSSATREESPLGVGGASPANKPKSSGELELERALVANKYILGRTATALGISVRQLVRRIIHAGITCPIVHGPGAKFSEHQIREMMELVRKAVPREQIREKYGCDLFLLRRMAIYDPALREDTKNAKREHVKLANRAAVIRFFETTHVVGRQMLYDSLPGPMSFLARYDKVWLRNVIDKVPKRIDKIRPPDTGRSKGDDDAFDCSTLARLEDVKEQISKMCPPRRVTVSLAFRVAGVSRRGFRRLSTGRMPQTEAFLRDFVETEKDFIRRKLRYAFDSLATSRRTVTASSVRAASGLTSEKLRQYRDYIHQLADESGIPFSSRAARWLG